MLSIPKLKKIFRFFLLGCLVLGLVTMVAAPGQAQFTMPQGFGDSSKSNQLPAGVERYGPIEVAPVRSPINNNVLFDVASPTVYDRVTNTKQIPVEQRAQEVKSKLELAIFDRDMEAKDLSVEVSKLNNVAVITVRNEEYPRPLVLVSVTENDADYNGLPIDTLADKWRVILDKEIREGQEKTTMEALAKTFTGVFRLFSKLLAATAVIIVIKYFIYRYHKVLLRRKQTIAEEQETELGSVTSADSSSFFSAILDQRSGQFWQKLPQVLSLDRQLGFWKFIQWLLSWVILIVWYIGIYNIVNQIPGLATLSGDILDKPLKLLLLWFFVGLAVRLSRRIIDILQNNWQKNDSGNLDKFIVMGGNQRRDLRISTIAGAIKGMVTVVITISGILNALTIVGIPTGSVVAIGGLLALAISFGSQSLVKDLVNGFLILAEDQYAVGDVIDVGFAAGGVENLNLRITQLRSGGGELVTIPNSAITQVKNLTRSWSRATLSIDVAYQTDPQKALSVLERTVQGLYDDPEWHEKILAQPSVLGIDSVSHSGMTITIWIQTAPAEQWSVGRELRLRVRQDLENNNIQIGTPRQVYSIDAVTPPPFEPSLAD